MTRRWYFLQIFLYLGHKKAVIPLAFEEEADPERRLLEHAVYGIVPVGAVEVLL